ncbi:hypothetical protein [Streptomyces brevispora]|uniref:hypothetical protein n=1 Tax=Streptomyces brevispora TaxID=887462 RepID=UPI0037F82154
MIGQGQADEGVGLGAVREVPAAVEPAQAGHGRAAEQQGIAGGDGRQRADVVAVRQFAEQFHPASAQAGRQAGVLDDPAQQVAVAVAGGGREGCVGHCGPFPHGVPRRFPGLLRHRALRRSPGPLPFRIGEEERCAEAGRQRGRRRPRFGECAQRARDDRGAVRPQQHDQLLPDRRRGEQSGVQPLPGQPQRLGPEYRIAAVRELVHEPRRPVRAGDAHLAHGLVQELARGLVAEDPGVVEHIGAQPGDPYRCRQVPGRAPPGPGAVRQPVAESLVEPGQEEIGLRESGEGHGQQSGEYVRPPVVGRGARGDEFGQPDQCRVTLPGVLVPDLSAQGVELFVDRRPHRRMLAGCSAAPPTRFGPASPGSVAAVRYVVGQRQVAGEGPHPQQAPCEDPDGPRAVRPVGHAPQGGDTRRCLDVRHVSSVAPPAGSVQQMVSLAAITTVDGWRFVSSATSWR